MRIRVCEGRIRVREDRIRVCEGRIRKERRDLLQRRILLLNHTCHKSA